MDSKEKSVEQLKKELSQKINAIKLILSQALDCALESDERIEFSNIIAGSLRAILYGDKQNGFKSLIERVGYESKLLFPIYNFGECLNLIPTYNLLQFLVNDSGAKVTISDNLFKTGGMWGAYLTFDSWINEVVIDTKLKDVEPLSRLLIIKIIADTAGVHVDSTIEEHVFNMSKHDLLPVVVRDGVEVPRNLEIKTESIFCETILAIANELVESYETWLAVSPTIIDPSKTIVRVQKYQLPNQKSQYKSLKFNAIQKGLPFQVNSYNSNSYYECEIYSREVSKYEVIKDRRRFEFIIVDYEFVLEGDYLGKSLYPVS